MAVSNELYHPVKSGEDNRGSNYIRGRKKGNPVTSGEDKRKSIYIRGG